MTAARVVVDSWAVLAFLRGEGEAKRQVARLLHRARLHRLRLLLNLVNLGEVYYRMIQVAGREVADERLQWIRAVPFELVPVREPLILEAARIKAAHPLSYADAFAVATARIEHAPILTGDPEIVRLPKTVVQVKALER